MSEFKISRASGQILLPIVSKGMLFDVNGSYMRRKTVVGQMYEVSGSFLRAARILDMTKPLQVSAIKTQVLVPVVVDATLTEIGVLVLQSQKDRVIPDATGSFLQTRMP